MWKIKPRRTASSRALTAASVVRCSLKTTTKCLWRARRYTPETEVNPPDTTPLVITPFSAAIGHRRTEPGAYFCWKLTLPVLLTLSDPRLGVLLKLTTDRHEASRGLSATAELLVVLSQGEDQHCFLLPYLYGSLIGPKHSVLFSGAPCRMIKAIVQFRIPIFSYCFAY